MVKFRSRMTSCFCNPAGALRYGGVLIVRYIKLSAHPGTTFNSISRSEMKGKILFFITEALGLFDLITDILFLANFEQYRNLDFVFMNFQIARAIVITSVTVTLFIFVLRTWFYYQHYRSNTVKGSKWLLSMPGLSLLAAWKMDDTGVCVCELC